MTFRYNTAIAKYAKYSYSYEIHTLLLYTTHHMGNLESGLKREINKTQVVKAIVLVLAASGVLAFAAVAPNALTLLRGVRTAQRKQTIKKALLRLEREGYVKIRSNQDVFLTEKGERLAGFLGEGTLAIKKPRRWDGKWRVLIFDIPEKRRGIREHTRRTLISLGFLRLQDSVWVFPYDCEDLISIFKIDFHIGSDLLYLIVDRIENDRALRRYFSLSG